jgi:DNA-directed RNA polymerase subunit RPC12/RpoP
MKSEKELENTIIYKCTECGLSNSIVKDTTTPTDDEKM